MFLKNILYLRKSDRQAVLFLLCVVLILSGIIYFIGGRNSNTVIAVADSLISDTIHGNMKYREKSAERYYATEELKPELFPFDPNTADSTQLLRLGLRPWQVRNIYKYRAAGGVYRKPSDFMRLYGLTVKQYKALEPYIHISSDYQPAATLCEKEEHKPFERDTIKYPVKLKTAERIHLNTSDTTMLKKVPGIGSAYARAIVSYRERLGGYCDVSQLMEIDGFPENSLTYFVVTSPSLRKININKLTLNQMKRHPYIGFFRAKAIADFRRLNGNITSLSQLSLCRDFTPEAIRRLEPYVEY